MRGAMIRILVGLLRLRGDANPGPLRRRVGSWMLRKVPGMLTCAQVEDFVHDYYEGELAEPQRKQFDLHLALCPMCQAHFESYVRSVALGQRVCEEDSLPNEMPEELVGAILLAVEEDRE